MNGGINVFYIYIVLFNKYLQNLKYNVIYERYLINGFDVLFLDVLENNFFFIVYNVVFFVVSVMT